MPTVAQTAHQAYVAAADLAPPRPRRVDVVVDDRRRTAPAADEEVEISRPMIVFGGAVLALIFGLVTGAWLQVT